jgi:dipeptidyl-peptidase-4
VQPENSLVPNDFLVPKLELGNDERARHERLNPEPRTPNPKPSPEALMSRPGLKSIILILALVPSALSAEKKPKDQSLLTLERIFASSEFVANSMATRWAVDGNGYLVLEDAAAGGGGQDIVRYDAETGEKTIVVAAADLVPPGETKPLAVNDYAFSQSGSHLLIFTNSQRVWRANTRGDYWVLDRAAHELRKLGGDAAPSTLMFARLSPQADKAAYVRENNIYVEDLQSGEIRALTADGSRTVINGTFDWVYEEEFDLRDGFRFSSDGQAIAYWQIDTAGVAEFTMLDNTAALSPRLTRFAYPKTGQQNPICRVGVANLADAKTRWLEVPGDNREHYIARMDWMPGTRRLLLQQLNRPQNTNRVMVANPESGKIETLLAEKDKAWVEVHDELMWIGGNKQFTWISERDGWRRVYLFTPERKSLEELTPKGYDAIQLLHVDEKQDRPAAYYIASPENAAERYLYRVGLDGRGARRLTPDDQPGWHDYQISPNGKWAIHRFSRMGSPARVELIALPDHKPVRVLVDNKKLCKRLDKLARRPVEFFRVEIENGVALDGWCIAPPKFDPKKKHPLLIYVYGEPAGQTVTDRWGGAQYLWHLMLAQRGYFVMSFDNRGTCSPRGRDWRKCIYRQVGILAPADQAKAVEKVLAERPYLDSDRVGVWGWSGGGSMALCAIFKYPKLYKTAMAVAPVPNQRLYDTIYQERYQGPPSDNVEGYLQGSAVNFAGQLEGNLLLVHGTGDDNCHYQGTEALINELVRHKKLFTMMAYPSRSHSIQEGAGTTLHLRTLLTDYLEKNLPPGPK